MMDVSIVIVNWNTKNITDDCLKSVYEQTSGIDFETIVIDNASEDGSAAMIKEKYPQAILIENTENAGFAPANNQGIEIAKGRYVLLLNSDTIVLDGAIQKTVDFADQIPNAAVVGCKVLNKDMTLQPSCFMFPSILNMLLSTSYLYKIFPHSKLFGREQMTWWDRNDVREVDVVTGCYMLVRKDAIDQIGVMDDDYFMYGEETDWCWRFKKAGWKNIFTPDAKIIHLGGQSSKNVKSKSLIRIKLGILQFIYKNKNRFVFLISCLLTLFFYLARIPYWSLRYLLSTRNENSKTYLLTYTKALVKIMKIMLIPAKEGFKI